jgi:hypothetical protein
VNVILRVVGVVIVEHVSDVLDVLKADDVSTSLSKWNVDVLGAIAILDRMRDLCQSVLREKCSIDDSVLWQPSHMTWALLRLERAHSTSREGREQFPWKGFLGRAQL